MTQQKAKSFITPAIILKRKNVGESDRLVTMLSPEYGKFVAVAKGARKINSSKRALLEPGSYIKTFCISTKSLPLLTQAVPIQDFAETRSSLIKIRQLAQILEITDRLFVEDEPSPNEFALVLEALEHLHTHDKAGAFLKKQLEQLCVAMGFQHPQDSQFGSILEYVAALSDRPMRSWEYLKTG